MNTFIKILVELLQSLLDALGLSGLSSRQALLLTIFFASALSVFIIETDWPPFQALLLVILLIAFIGIGLTYAWKETQHPEGEVPMNNDNELQPNHNVPSAMGSFGERALLNRPRLMLVSHPSLSKPVCEISEKDEIFLGQGDNPADLRKWLRAKHNFAQYLEQDRLVAIPPAAGICDKFQARIVRDDTGHYRLFHGGRTTSPVAKTLVNGYPLDDPAGLPLEHGQSFTFQESGKPVVELIFLEASEFDAMKNVTGALELLGPEDQGNALIRRGQPREAARVFEDAVSAAAGAKYKYQLLRKAEAQWENVRDRERADACRWRALQLREGPLIEFQPENPNLQEDVPGVLHVRVRNTSQSQPARNIWLNLAHEVLKTGFTKYPESPFDLAPNENRRVTFQNVIPRNGGDITLRFSLSFATDYDVKPFHFYDQERTIQIEHAPQPTQIGNLVMGDGVIIDRGKGWICPGCGTHHPSGILYCTNCGTKLSG